MNSIAQAVPEAALQAIRKLIKEQGFGPGDALPSQRDLAVQLGVSRASLREALSSLSALGVVSVQPGKGVFVQAVGVNPAAARVACRSWAFTGRCRSRASRSTAWAAPASDRSWPRMWHPTGR